MNIEKSNIDGACTCVIIWTGVEWWVGWVEGWVRWRRVKLTTRILDVMSTRVARVLPHHSGSGVESMDWRWSRVDVEVHIDVHIDTAFLIIRLITCLYPLT